MVCLFAILFSGIEAQTEGSVYFLGIGIENSGTPDIPQKTLAKSDVNAVLAKTTNDLNNNTISYYSKGIDLQITYSSDIIQHCLFEEKATLESISHAFSEIATQANPYDIFYFYINAPCDAKTGAFYLPSSPLKKGEKPGPLVMLDPAKLQSLFALIPCHNQIVIVDHPAWKKSLDLFSASFFQTQEKQKNQVLVVPTYFTADTFSIMENGKSVDNKKAGLLAALICSTPKPLLNIFLSGGVDNYHTLLTFTTASLPKTKPLIVGATISSNSSNSSAGALVDKSSEKNISNGSLAKDIPAGGSVFVASTPAPLEKPKSKPASRGPIAVDDQQQLADSIIGSIRNYALIVGVSDYKDSAWHDLPNPVADASSLNDELSSHYGFETTFLQNPTKSELYKALTGLMTKNFDQNSQVLIFFAGHGGKNEFDGYFVPADGKNPKQDEEMNSVITYSSLWRIIKGLPSQHVLLMIDACYSGTFDEDVMASNRELASEKKPDLDKLRLVKEKMHYKFKAYIASGITPVSDGKPGEHSPFMTEVLNCLRKGYAENNITTFYNVSAAVEKVTTPVPRCNTISMEPGGDFLFIPQVKH